MGKSLKVYLATPVNGRKEGTLEEKQEAAQERINEMADYMRRFYHDAEFMSSFDIFQIKYGIGNISEAIIMGECVRMVMESDLVIFDDGWESSNGCNVEHYVAMRYGKQIEIIDKYKMQAVMEAIYGSAEKQWQPAKSLDEAVSIVKAHPITKEMTYEQRLAAQKARFGL